MNGFAKLTTTEFTLLRRDVASMILPFALPLGLLVGFGSGSGAMHEAAPELGGMTPFELFIVPIALVLVLPMMALTVFPVTLSSYRERGVLRRLATTPVHPMMLLGAQLAVHVGLLVTSLGLTAVVAGTVFGVSAPRQPGAAVGVLAAGTVALYGLGVTIASLAPKASTATAYGMGLFFPQLLLGGLMVPADQLPAVLARIGEFTPVGATLHGLQAAWVGDGVELVHVAVLALWAIGTIAFSAVRFRWD
ncbi:MAG TPA: ABC transporter permease [Egicoccus sp.]|nr:ABC transporter permease [Egicoccus sp.]HSK24517.1 ABC transporter permease [Egicoccus sp.]